MSIAISAPYRTHIEACQECLAECYRCLDSTSPTEACHRCLRDCANALKNAVRLMQVKSPLASRYLVDCAEICEECARCADNFANDRTLQCAEVCRKTMTVCRQGSAVDV